MEFLSNGELFDYVWKKQGLEESEARRLFAQIVEGVHYCHQNSVVHRDLKLENILLDDNMKPKLADFGFSKEVDHEDFLETYCGSPLYASPEMILGRPYFGSECDVWSLGVILYTMLTATMPFDDRDVPSFLSCVEKGVYPEPPEVSEMAKDLLSKMLNPHPLSRASIEDILSHPWLEPRLRHTRQRHLSRHPARPFLCEPAQLHATMQPPRATSLDLCAQCSSYKSAGHRDAGSKRCPHLDSHTRQSKTGRKIVIRKNSSGYSSSSGYASDLPSPDLLSSTTSQ
jgi:serine/threonine protein kinase